MSVMVPIRSGLTDASMSKRSSFQEGSALVVRSFRLVPQPTWRNVFMAAQESLSVSPAGIVGSASFMALA
jgi:hypothetical protein